MLFVIVFFFSSRRRHTRCALVTGVQTCAFPICLELDLESRSGGPQKEAAGPDGLANVVTLDSATYDDRSAEMEHDQMGASSRNLGGERLLALFRDEHGTPAEIAARPVDAVLGPQDDAMRVA